MTYAQWDALKLPMQWSMYTQFDENAVERSILDLSTNAPDGEYAVQDNTGPPVGGITVKNGEFVPEPTALACYEASARGHTIAIRAALGGEAPTDESIAARSPIDHCFIEELKFDPSTKTFILTAGS